MSDQDRQIRRIVIAYLGLGLGWIIIADVVLWLLARAPGEAFPVVQTLKGTVFVLLSAAFLSWMIGGEFRRRRDADGERAFQARLIGQLGQSVVVTDLEGTIVSWNEGASRLHGWSADEAVGRSLVELIIPESHREEARHTFEEMRSGRFFEGEFVIRTKDEDTIPVFVTCSPVRDESGVLIGFAGAAHSLEKLRRVESEAEAAARRFRALIEGSTDLVAILDENGVVEYSSPSRVRILGQHPDEIIGQNILDSDQIHPEDLPAARRHLRQLLNDPGGEIRTVLRTRHADGSWRLLDVRAVNHLDDPVTNGIVINSRDVTEKRDLEHQLLQAQKMEAVGQLAGGVAHDFNNLTTTILGTCDILLDGMEEADPAYDEVHEIRAAALRGAELTRQLLAFSRQQVLRPTPNVVGEVVQSMERMLVRLIGEDVHLTVRADREPWQVRVDRSQLEQVVMNLVVNALDAIESGGRIEVAVSKVDLDEDAADALSIAIEPGSYVELRVSDDGTGISPEIQERMFEPFFTTKETGRGTGLGLSTVLGIVQQSGGYITVASGPGEGTTFRIFLVPAERDLQAPEGTDSVRGAAVGVAGRRGTDCEPGLGSGLKVGSESPNREGMIRILVVEDDLGVSRAIKKGLNRLGYDTTTVSSGQEGISMLSKGESFDIVVSDLVMPGLSGADLVRRLREEYPDLPVIVMSGYTSDRVEREGLAELADGFVQKPFTPDLLNDAIRMALS